VICLNCPKLSAITKFGDTPSSQNLLLLAVGKPLTKDIPYVQVTSSQVMFQLAEGSGAKVLTFMDVALAAGILVVHNSLAFQISELTPCGACRLRYALAKKPMTKMLIPTYSNEYQILECSIMATWCFDGDEVTNLGSQPPPSTFKVVIYHVISVSDKLL